MHLESAFRSEERFTQKQFRRWVDRRKPGDIHRYELLHGQIVMSPPAGWSHGHLEIRLARLIEEHVVAESLGMAFASSTGIDLPSGDTVQPDVSFVATERLRAHPPAHPSQFLRAVPNLVIEILSPSTQRRDRTEKRALYERNGVDEYWIVDPVRRCVTIFHRTPAGYGRGRTFRRGVVQSRVLPRLRVSVPALFRL